MGKRVAAALSAALAMGLASAGAAPLRIPDAALEFVAFADLDGWADDDHAAAFAAFRKSCAVVVKRTKKRKGLALDGALREVCPRALKLPAGIEREAARRFFEENFRPVRISRLGEGEGFLTGYYEPEVEGSRTATPDFSVPIYRKPHELAVRVRKVVRRKPAQRRTARRAAQRAALFHERAAIDDGALKGRELEICWVREPADAFFIHIQGSARVRLENGSILRLNYAAQNGHTYTAIGRFLIEKGIVTRDDMSMERIRTFVAEHPEEGHALMRLNKSYVFFREASELPPDAEAVGAQGIPLSRGRSLAVDRKIHAFGSPFWIAAALPLENEGTVAPFRRLMIAQDTGGAIVGPARGDIYFGAGSEAGAVAGRIKHPGRFYLLVPRAADPARLLDPVPLPRPKP
jgi:membrane-bound lytic murein transglycosylase A